MKKGFSIGFLAVHLIILLNVNISVAIPWKNRATKGDNLVHNQWEEEEFSLDSEFCRMLHAVSETPVGATGNRGHPAFNCQGAAYRSCLPDPNTGGPRRRCAAYSRDCN